MTNSNDFRRYSYATDVSYAINTFDAHRNTAPACAPPQRKKVKVNDPLAKTIKKSKAELLKEERLSVKSAAKIVVITALCVGVLFAVLCSFVQKNELTHEIASIQNQINMANSESTRLNSDLDALVSMSMIDQYAVEKLGMTKASSSQINYVDVSQYQEMRLASLKDKSPAATAQALKE